MGIGCYNLSMLRFVLIGVERFVFYNIFRNGTFDRRLIMHYVMLNVVDQYHFCGWLTVCSAIERNESVYIRILC